MAVNINLWSGATLTGHPKEWTCWSCGTNAGGQWGYHFAGKQVGHCEPIRDAQRFIYICPKCGAPAYFPNAASDKYEPKSLPGAYMESLPDDMSALYIEMRRCIGSGAYTSAVLTARKLLMHIAVELGAKPGINFAKCVKYICENGFPGKAGEVWVKRIREKGNEANHQIRIMDKDDAVQMLKFLELILNGNYEYPAEILKMEESAKQNTENEVVNEVE